MIGSIKLKFATRFILLPFWLIMGNPYSREPDITAYNRDFPSAALVVGL
jgi:hypothetical protein